MHHSKHCFEYQSNAHNLEMKHNKILASYIFIFFNQKKILIGKHSKNKHGFEKKKKQYIYGNLEATPCFHKGNTICYKLTTTIDRVRVHEELIPEKIFLEHTG